MIVSPPLNDELSIYGILEGCVIDTRIKLGSSVGNLKDPGPFILTTSPVLILIKCTVLSSSRQVAVTESEVRLILTPKSAIMATKIIRLMLYKFIGEYKTN